MENLAEALIPVFIFMPVALIIKIISDNNIRRKLIDKGMVDENVKYLFLKKEPLRRLHTCSAWFFF